MADPFRQLTPGEVLPGLPSEPWNVFLDGIKGHPRGKRPEGGLQTSVEYDVLNDTDEDVIQFGILGIETPLNTYGVDSDDFLYRDTMRGTTPRADKSFVVVQAYASPGEVVRGRALGLTRVQIRLNSSGDTFAGPGTSTEYLESAASGPAQIVWIEPGSGSGSGSGSGPGTHWAVVILGGGSGGGTRVEPGEPRGDGVIPPEPEFESWTRLDPNLATMTLDPVEAIWFWDLNRSP
jgi:hypothetical protein